jgi:hypothetical protein
MIGVRPSMMTAHLTLRARRTTAFPLSEISAFAERRCDGATELLAVGDEDFALAVIPFAPDGPRGEAERHDLSSLLVGGTGSGATSGSQFEGLACDGAGRVFLLQEETERVLVLSADLSELLGAIRLVVEADQRDFGADWRRDETSRGEALLLLDSGHLLVVKQRRSVQFIEFGPAGDEPLGVGPESYPRPGQPFDLAGGSPYEVLAWWGLTPAAAERFKSVNDVALGADDRLYVLSGASSRLGRLEPRLRVGESHAAIPDFWDLPAKLPGGRKARPEALALGPSDVPIVGMDTREPGDNVVVFDPLGS